MYSGSEEVSVDARVRFEPAVLDMAPCSPMVPVVEDAPVRGHGGEHEVRSIGNGVGSGVLVRLWWLEQPVEVPGVSHEPGPCIWAVTSLRRSVHGGVGSHVMGMDPP